METSITARHCEIPDALRERATTVVQRIGNLAARPMETAVVFDADGSRRTVELRLHVARGEVFVAKGEGPDHRTALDRAETRLKRQVSKAFGRSRRGRHSQTSVKQV